MLAFNQLLIFLFVLLRACDCQIRTGLYRWGNVTRCPYMIQTQRSTERTAVPEVMNVWVYWHDETSIPLLVERAIANNRAMLEKGVKYQYQLKFLSSANISDFLDMTVHPLMTTGPTDNVALLSDFIRLSLLKQYGGVYLDASVVLTKPLDWWFGQDEDEPHQLLISTYGRKAMNQGCDYPLIESTTMFSPPNHPLIEKWLSKLFEVTEYTDSAIDEFFLRHEHIPLLNYLFKDYHVAFHALHFALHENSGLANFSDVMLYDSKELHYFFYNYLNKLVLFELSVEDMFKHAKYGHAALKFIGTERELLEKLLQLTERNRGFECERSKTCFASEYLGGVCSCLSPPKNKVEL